MMNEMNDELVIESRFERLEYLQDTTALGADPENLLIALVSAMSDREFHEQYVYLCRMHDIEPDMDKFQKGPEESNDVNTDGKITDWQM